MLFPMYTVPLDIVLKMTEIHPHEHLKSDGMLVEFDENKGKGLFVSHQWVGNNHPDPDFKQFQARASGFCCIFLLLSLQLVLRCFKCQSEVLQDALKNVLSELPSIPVDADSQGNFPSAKSLPTSGLRSSSLYVWYDYFSCPQLENKHFSNQESNLAKAVDSIPAYVERCAFFFVLCPVLESQSLSRVFSRDTWAERGWCRVERVCRELSTDGSYVFIKTPKVMELSIYTTSLKEAPGEGIFTVEADRGRLGPVLMGAIQRKLLHLLKSQDFVSWIETVIDRLFYFPYGKFVDTICLVLFVFSASF